MGKISEIFNFDNIGGKIKNLAKWSCWITVILIWIAAAIMLVGGIAEGGILALLTLLAAVVASIVVWVGSWAMYAFGEFVEKITDNEENTRQILKKLTEDDCGDDGYTVSETIADNELVNDEDIEDDKPQEYVSSITEAELKQKIARIAGLRKKGLISEELYQKAINNPRILDKF